MGGKRTHPSVMMHYTGGNSGLRGPRRRGSVRSAPVLAVAVLLAACAAALPGAYAELDAVSSALDVENQRIVLVFDSTVNISSVDPTRMHVRNGDTLSGGITLEGDSLVTAGDSDVLVFELTSQQYSQLGGFADPWLHFDADALSGPAGSYPGSSTFTLPSRTAFVSVGAQERVVRAMAFSPDGLTMLITGDAPRRVFQYALSGPYDIESAELEGSADLDSRTGDPLGLAFSNDGLRMFVSGTTGHVGQYSVGAPFDVVSSPISYVAEYDAANEGGAGQILDGLAFDPGGTRMFVSDLANDQIRQYDLTVPYSPGLIVDSAGSLAVGGSALNPSISGISFSPDGLRIFMTDAANNMLHVYRAQAPYDVREATLVGRPLDLSALGGRAADVLVMPGGTDLLIAENIGTDGIHRIQLASLYDGALVTPSVSSSIGGETSGIAFSADGLYMLVTDTEESQVRGFRLSAPYDTSTAVFDDVTNVSLNRPVDVILHSSNHVMYVLDRGNERVPRDGKVLEYFLTSPYNLTSATFSGGELRVGDEDNMTGGFAHNDDGTSVFVTGHQSDSVHRYDLSDPYRPIPAVYAETLDVSDRVRDPSDVEFALGGLFMLLTESDGIMHSYSLGQPYDLGTASYGRSFTGDRPGGLGGAVPLLNGSGIITLSGDGTISRLATAALPLRPCDPGQPLAGGACGDLGEPPAFASAIMGLAGREIEITFDRPVDAASVRPDRITITDGVGLVGGVQLSSAAQVVQGDPNTIRFELNRTDASTVFGYDDPTLRFDGGALRGTFYNFPPGFEVPGPPVAGSADISDRTEALSGVEFSADGSVMYAVSADPKGILQYSLGTPYDIDAAEYYGRFDISSRPGDPEGMSFSPDGGRMYVAMHDRVFQYRLDVPFVVLEAGLPEGDSFADGSCNSPTRPQGRACRTGGFTAGSVELTDAVVSSDGGRLFIVDGGTVHQYALFPRFNINSAASTPDASFALVEDPAAGGLRFSPDGLIMIVTGGSGHVYRYDLDEPFDLSGMSSTPFLEVDAQDASPSGVAFSADGHQMFIAGSETGTIYRYVLPRPFDPAVSAYDGLFDSGASPGGDGIAAGPGGESLFLTSSTDLYRHFMIPPYNILGADPNESNMQSVGGSAGRGLAASPSGHRVYAALDGSMVAQLNSGPPVDLVPDTTIRLADTAGDLQGIEVSDDGQKIFVADGMTRTIHQYYLDESFAIGQGNRYAGSFALGSEVGDPTGLYMSPGGDSMFISDGDQLHEYSLRIPYEVSTASYRGDLELSQHMGNATAVTFSDDGLVMYVSGNDGVHQYLLGARQLFVCPAQQHIENGACAGEIPSGIELAPPGLDGATGLLQMPFNELINAESIQPGLISVRDGLSATSGVGPLDSVPGDGDSVVRLELGGPELDEAYNYTNPYLHFEAGALANLAGDPFPIPHDSRTAVRQAFFPVDDPPADVAFSADGLGMIVAGGGVAVYTLADPFDVRGAVLFGMSEPEANYTAVEFSADGTVMLLASEAGIDSYSLNAPYFPIGGILGESYSPTEEAAPLGLAASDDGRRIFVTGASGSVHQYDLSAPYALNTALLAGSFDVSGQDRLPSGVSFAGGGSIMHVAGGAGGLVHMYELFRPFDVTSAEYTGPNRAGRVPGGISGVAFSGDGLRMFSADADPAGIIQYALNVRQLAFEPDGPRLLDATLEIRTGTIIVKLDRVINTSSISDESLILADANDPDYSFPFSSSLFRTTEADSDVIRMMAGGGEFDITGIAPESPALAYQEDAFRDRDGRSFPVPLDVESLQRVDRFSSGGDAPEAVTFSSDGTTMLMANGTSFIYQYSLDPPYRLAGATYEGMYNTGSDTPPTGLFLSPDDRQLFVAFFFDDVYRYSLSRPAEITSGVQRTQTLAGGPSGLPAYRDVIFSPDGLRMFLATLDGNAHQYDLAVPYSLSLAELQHSAFVSRGGSVGGMWFSPGGTELLVSQSNANGVYRFDLSLPYDLGNVSGSTFDSVGVGGVPNDLAFSHDGRTMFIAGAGSLNSYDLFSRDLALCPGDPVCGTITAQYPLFALDAPEQSDAADARRVLDITDAPTISEDLVEQLRPTRAGDLPLFSDSATVIGKSFALVSAVADSGGILSIVFDAPVDHSSVDASRIHIRDGNDAEGLTLLPVELSSTGTGNTVSFGLNETRIGEVLAQSSPRLHFDEGALNGAGGERFPEPFALPLPAQKGSLNVAAQDGTPQGAAFSPDGMIMLMAGTGSDAVHQYDLPAAYDVEAAEYSGASLATPGMEPVALVFADGGRLLIILDGAGFAVRSYEMTDPYNISTAAPSGGVLSTSGREVEPRGIAISPDGLSIFVTGQGSNSVHQYSLGTAFDLSTGSYSGKSVSVAEQETNIQGVAFSARGDLMFIVGTESDLLHRYELSGAFDLSGRTHTGSLYIAGTGGDAMDLALSTDGRLAFIPDSSSDSIHRYELDGPYGIDGTPTGEYGLPDSAPTGVAFSADGTLMLISGNGGDAVYGFALDPPFDLSAPRSSGSFSTAAEDTVPRDVDITADGGSVFVMGRQTDSVHRYDLASPFEITAPTHNGSFFVGETETTPNGLAFTQDGDGLFIVGFAEDAVYEYNLEGPYDLNGSMPNSSLAGSLNLGDRGENPTDVYFLPGGDVMLAASVGAASVLRYDLESAYNISTAEYAGSFSVRNEGTSPTGLAYSADGMRLFVTDAVTDAIHWYELGTYPVGITQSSAASDVPLFSDDASASIPPPGLVSVTAHAGDILRIVFDQPIDHSTVNASRIHARDGNETTGVTLVQADLVGPGTGNTVSFNMSGNLGEILDYSSPRLHFDADALRSIHGDSFPRQFELPLPSYRGSFGVAVQETRIEGVAFSPDGRRMIITGTDSGAVHQYDLPRPYDMQAARYSGISIPTMIEPVDLAFADGGSLLVILGIANDAVHAYRLAEPYDIVNAIPTEGVLSVRSQAPAPRGIAISSDGLQVFVTGQESDSVHEYSLGTAFDLSTGVYNASIEVMDQAMSPQGVTFSADGTLMFITGANSKSLHRYELDGAFNIAGSTHTGTFYLADNAGSPSGLDFSADGRLVFVSDFVFDAVHVYELDGPYGIDGPPTGMFGLPDADPTGVAFSADGTLMIVSGNDRDGVFGFELGLPFDLSAPGTNRSFSTSGEDAEPHDVDISADGGSVFVIGREGGRVHRYDLASPYNITAPTPNGSFFVGGSEPFPSGLEFTPDGEGLFIVGADEHTVYEYSLAGPYDLRGSMPADSLVGSFSVKGQDDSPVAVSFSTDGHVMFAASSARDRVLRYELGSPYGLGSVEYTGSFNLRDQGTSPTGLAFSADGLRMFFTDSDTAAVYWYQMGTHPIGISQTAFARNITVAEGDAPGIVDGGVPDVMRKLAAKGNSTPGVGDAATADRTVRISEVDMPVIIGDGVHDITGDGVAKGNSTPGVGDAATADRTAKISEVDMPGIVDGGVPNATRNEVAEGSSTPGVVDGAATARMGKLSADDTPDVADGGVHDAMRKLVANGTSAPGVSDRAERIINGVMMPPDLQVVSIVLDSRGVLEITFDGMVNKNVIKHGLISIADGYAPAGRIPLTAGEITTAGPDSLRYALDANKWNLVRDYADPRLRFDIGALGPGLPDVGYRLPDTLYPYELDTASVDLNNTEESPQALAFSVDGTVMFTVGLDLDTVFRYVLEQPYDISSARIDGSHNVGDQEEDPRGLAFSADGLKMFVAGNDTVHQYSLGSQFGFNPAPSFNASFSTVEDGLVTGIDFGRNGTIMYLSGANNSAIQQYDLSSPYDITVQPVHAGNFSTVSQDDSPRGVIVSEDGRNMLVLGGEDDRVYMYGIDEPHNITTAGYVGSLQVRNQENNPEGMAASADGRLLFVTGTQNNEVHRYDLGAPYDAAQVRADGGPTFNVYNNVDNRDGPGRVPTGIVFSPDGLQMFVSSHALGTVQAYNLTVPYSVTTATAADSYATATSGLARDRPFDVEFSADGLWMFNTGREGQNLYSYTLDTPYNITSAVQNGTYDIETSAQAAVVFNPEGTIMLLAVETPGSIQEYNLPNPFNISGAVAAPFSIGDGLSPVGLEYSSDGHRLFIMDNTEVVHRYDLLTPYSLNVSLFIDSEVFNSDAQTNDITFSGDGRKLFIAGGQGHNIVTYNLTSPYDITSSARSTALLVETSSNPTPSDVSVSNDGRSVLVFNNLRDRVSDYTLLQPYDLSTRGQQAESPAAANSNVNAMEFSSNGTLMFLMGWTAPAAGDNPDNIAGREIHTYNLSTAFDTTTAQLIGSFITGSVTNPLPSEPRNEPPDKSISSPSAMRFSPDGIDLFIIDEIERAIHHFNLSSPYLVDNTTAYVESLDVENRDSNPSGLAFSADGKRMFITGANRDAIQRYDLDIAHNLSTAVYSGLISVGRLENQPRGIAFSEDGSRLFFTGEQRDLVYLFDLAGPETIRVLPGVLDDVDTMTHNVPAVDKPSVFDGPPASTVVRTLIISENDILSFEETDGIADMASPNATDKPGISDPVRLAVSFNLAGDDAPTVLDVPGVGEIPDRPTLVSVADSLMFEDPVAVDVMISSRNASDTPAISDPVRLAVQFFLTEDDAPTVLDVPGVGEIPDRPTLVSVADSLMFEDPVAVDVMMSSESVVRNGTDKPAVSDEPRLVWTIHISENDTLSFEEIDDVGGMTSRSASDTPAISDPVRLAVSFNLAGDDAPTVADVPDVGEIPDRPTLVSVGDSLMFVDLPGVDVMMGRNVVERNGTDRPAVSDEPRLVRTISLSGNDTLSVEERDDVGGTTRRNGTDTPIISDPVRLSVLFHLTGDDAPTVLDVPGVDEMANRPIPLPGGDSPSFTELPGANVMMGRDAVIRSVTDAPTVSEDQHVARITSISEDDSPSFEEIPGVDDMTSRDAADMPAVSDSARLSVQFFLSGDDAPTVVDVPDVDSGRNEDAPTVAERISLGFSRMASDEPTVADSAQPGPIMIRDIPDVDDSVAFGLSITVSDEPTVADRTPGLEPTDAPAVSDLAEADRIRPAPPPEPRPVPRSSGGGGGGGGGGGLAPTGSSLGYSASFDFTSGGINTLTAPVSIRLASGLPLVITPVLNPGTLTVYDMEIRLNDIEGAAAEVYYNRLGAFYGKECGGETAESASLYTCDVSSAISGAASHSEKGGALESISIPLQDGFSGTMTLMLRDNQGLKLADHERLYRVSTILADTPIPSGPPAAEPQPSAEPQPPRQVEPPGPAAQPPRDEPAAPSPVEPEPQAPRPGTPRMDPEPSGLEQDSARDSAPEDMDILGRLIDFFRSLFG
ncbi:hypothetical protein CENSYa_0917 [Cenarchaeum symbiosum A]|uniref:Uncharacterized protein n=1 Tax=Cenarchaeum symbiosum (strain A) TaxID=414004 RepID=A0RW32_CENSY|nr:hypothetical protein CENSYa_0917 [Cenarchaeum symbiosum A]